MLEAALEAPLRSSLTCAQAATERGATARSLLTCDKRPVQSVTDVSASGPKADAEHELACGCCCRR